MPTHLAADQPARAQASARRETADCRNIMSSSDTVDTADTADTADDDSTVAPLQEPTLVSLLSFCWTLVPWRIILMQAATTAGMYTAAL